MKLLLTMTFTVALFLFSTAGTQDQGFEGRLTEAEWTRALTHVESNIRERAMYTLAGKAKPKKYQKDTEKDLKEIEEAIPLLLKCVNRQFPFPTMEEVDSYQLMAMTALAQAKPDLVVEGFAKYLAANVRKLYDYQQSKMVWHVIHCLDQVKETSVNIDEPLMAALSNFASMNADQQKTLAAGEGYLLIILARLAKDREKAAKIVLSRMRWAIGKDLYSPNHFTAVQLCAEHADRLITPLIQSYRDNENKDRMEALGIVAALAVYHKDARAFITSFLQDRFISSYQKKNRVWRYFVEIWLLSPETTQDATREEVKKLFDVDTYFSNGAVSLYIPGKMYPGGILKAFQEKLRSK